MSVEYKIAKDIKMQRKIMLLNIISNIEILSINANAKRNSQNFLKINIYNHIY